MISLKLTSVISFLGIVCLAFSCSNVKPSYPQTNGNTKSTATSKQTVGAKQKTGSNQTPKSDDLVTNDNSTATNNNPPVQDESFIDRQTSAPVDPNPQSPMETVPMTFTDEQKIQKIKDQCTTLQRTTRNFNVNFSPVVSSTGTACKWTREPDTNGVKADAVIHGIGSQSVSVTLPKGAVLCSSQLLSLEEDDWGYDDEVALTQNGVVLVTSQKEYVFGANSGSLQTPYSHGYLWNWAKIDSANIKNNQGDAESLYCFGLEQGGSCLFPNFDVPNPVSINIPLEAMAPLSLKSQLEGKLEYSLHVTGDNTRTRDCKHSGISFDLEASYVIPQL